MQKSNNTKIFYFIFAGERSPVLDYVLPEDRIAYIEDNPEELYDVFRYDPDEFELTDLLDFAMQWHQYVLIDEEEYYDLKQLK